MKAVTLDQLSERFKIPPVLLDAAQVRNATDASVRELLGVRGRMGEDLSGIIFPYRDPREGRLLGHRVRLDTPSTNGQKYLSEQGCRALFFPPTNANVLVDSSVPVIMVEAEKSALALAALAARCERNLLPIGIGGVWGWKRTAGLAATPDGARESVTGPSPSFDWVVWKGRKVYLAFDSNVAGRRDLERARRGLAEELKRRGAKVFIASVPRTQGVNGPDDLIAIAGDKATLEMLDRAAPFAPAKLGIWDGAESMEAFLESGEEDAEFLDGDRRLVARSCVTEIFAPRGLGKSITSTHLAVDLAGRGLRVFLIDRDNPRHVVRNRLKSLGAGTHLESLKVLTREQCPPLTNAQAWADFPYDDYDLVILDSLDSAAEGMGEQDSAKPARAIAPLLDIARRENGPAVLVLGNTVRSGQHSRGSGVIEDRADIVYEVRDATDFHPTGQKAWVEELPASEAGAWASRASRRKQREQYRLAFVATKFRIGQEPEPFIIEVDLSNEPWTVRDVTGDVDREGNEVRKQKAAQKAARLDAAAEKLKAEISRRTASGDEPLRKRQDAEPFLMKLNLKRKEARNLLIERDGTEWELRPSPEDRRITYVMPVAPDSKGGHTSMSTEAATDRLFRESECGRPHEQGTATFDAQKTSVEPIDFEGGIVAEPSIPRPDEAYPGGPSGLSDEDEVRV